VSVRIPLLRVAGGHREVGRAVGAATAPVLRDAVAFDAAIPGGRSREEQLALAARYRDATRAATPWLVEEIDGAAEGAGVDPVALFAASVEEIWTVRPSQAGTAEPVPGRCSDLVIGPPFTADGHLWVAHNNDLGEESEPQVVAVEWRVPGEPVVFSLGIGPWISVGWNDAGLSLTGNELSPNDERVGVPRLLMVREQLTATILDEAVAMALRSDRASSYNTVFAHRDGRSANVEGSGGDAVVRRVGPGETLAHTNHYVEPAMLRYEGDPAYARRSAARYERACALLAAATGAPPGSVTPDVLRAWLSDHAGAPDSLCRHPGGGRVDAGRDGDGRRPTAAEVAAADGVADAAAESRVKTVFWAIADVTAGSILYGRGNPCAGHEPERYAFA
jgi:isopenicillin-N N-acyltransferase-like protein